MLRIDRARHASSQLDGDGSPAFHSLPSLAAASSLGDRDKETADESPTASAEPSNVSQQGSHPAVEDSTLLSASSAADAQPGSRMHRAEAGSCTTADRIDAQSGARSSQDVPQGLESSNNASEQHKDLLGFNFATLGISFGSREQLADSADGAPTAPSASSSRMSSSQTDGQTGSSFQGADLQPGAAQGGQPERVGTRPTSSAAGGSCGPAQDSANRSAAARGDKSSRETLDYQEAFWLATMGGAQALGLEVCTPSLTAAPLHEVCRAPLREERQHLFPTCAKFAVRSINSARELLTTQLLASFLYALHLLQQVLSFPLDKFSTLWGAFRPASGALRWARTLMRSWWMQPAELLLMCFPATPPPTSSRNSSTSGTTATSALSGCKGAWSSGSD